MTGRCSRHGPRAGEQRGAARSPARGRPGRATAPGRSWCGRGPRRWSRSSTTPATRSANVVGVPVGELEDRHAAERVADQHDRAVGHALARARRRGRRRGGSSVVSRRSRRAGPAVAAQVDGERSRTWRAERAGRSAIWRRQSRRSRVQPCRRTTVSRAGAVLVDVQPDAVGRAARTPSAARTTADMERTIPTSSLREPVPETSAHAVALRPA